MKEIFHSLDRSLERGDEERKKFFCRAVAGAGPSRSLGVHAMARPVPEQLSRREREIMNALYRLGEAGAADVAAELRDEEAYDSIRVTLGILEKKGHLRKRREKNRNLYAPAVPLSRAKRSALRNVLHTFFEGSSSKAILTLLDSGNLSDEELDEIETLLQQRREEQDS